MRRQYETTVKLTKCGIEFKAHIDRVTDVDGESWLDVGETYVNGKRDFVGPRVESALLAEAKAILTENYKMGDYR